MELTIKKNSTQLLIVDPREYGDANVDWDAVLTNAVVTFSLYDVENGCYVIASRAGEIIPGGLSVNDKSLTNAIECGANTEVTRIAYQFRSKDTKHTGVYRGTFQVNVIGEPTVLAVPTLGDIQVMVVESGIQPWSQTVYTGLPDLGTDVPSGSTPTYSGSPLIPMLWADIDALRVNSLLIPGQEYVVLDYQTIHRIPGKTTINEGPIEPLIIQAVAVDKIHKQAKSTVYPQDIIIYGFSNEFVQCEDSFDIDYTSAGTACQSSGSAHRPGYIEYRENTTEAQSSYYDFRAFVNAVGSLTGNTFAPGTSGKLGRNSGNILIKSGANIEVGENSQGLVLTRIASRIKIGSDVRGFNTDGKVIPNQVSSNSVFELGDNGLQGFSTVALVFPSDYLSGTKTLGLLPSNCMVSGLEIVAQSLKAAAGAKIAMGIEDIDKSEIFPLTDLNSVASGLFSAQVTTRSSVANKAITVSLEGTPITAGKLHLKTSFTNIGSGVSITAPTPGGGEESPTNPDITLQVSSSNISVGDILTYTSNVVGGNPPYTYYTSVRNNLSGASELLNNNKDGSWVATTEGPFTFSVTVADSSKDIRYDDASVSVMVSQPITALPKKLIGWGDSIMFKHDASKNFLSAFEQMVTRLNAPAIAYAQIGHPGEAAKDFLNSASRKAEFEAAIDPAYDNYVLVNLGTNDYNQDYSTVVKGYFQQLITYVKSKGIKGIVWNMVNACKSPYAFARDINGNIIGSSTSERQAAFDALRLDMNAVYLPSLVLNGSLFALSNTSIYDKIYPVAQADELDYYIPIGQGPYAGAEPGKVHQTEYGNKYLAEAWAQAVAPMLGVVLSPATVVIPDKPVVIQPEISGETKAALYSLANVSTVDNTVTAIDGAPSFSAIANSTKKLSSIGMLGWKPVFLVGNVDGSLLGIASVRTANGGFSQLAAAVYFDPSDSFNIYKDGSLIFSSNNSIKNATIGFALSVNVANATLYDCQVSVNGVPVGPVFTIPAAQYFLSSALTSRTAASAYFYGDSQLVDTLGSSL